MLTTIAEIAVTMSAPQPEERAAPDTHPALARFACLALAGDHARQGMLTRVSGDRLGVALGPLELAGTARALADGLGGELGHVAQVLTWDTRIRSATARMALSQAVVPACASRAARRGSSTSSTGRGTNLVQLPGPRLGTVTGHHVRDPVQRQRDADLGPGGPPPPPPGAHYRPVARSKRPHVPAPRRARGTCGGGAGPRARHLPRVRLPDHLRGAVRDRPRSGRAGTGGRIGAGRGRPRAHPARPVRPLHKGSAAIEEIVRLLEAELPIELESISGVAHADVLAATPGRTS